VLGIEATGVVDGIVYLDRNGNRFLDGADTALSNLPIRLVAMGTRDTTARASSNAQGFLRLSAVPIGTYRVVVDTILPGDSIRVTRVDTTVITLIPNDTVTVRVNVGFPQLTLAEARAATPGRKMFVAGVALIARNLFGDTTLHIADPTTAVRLTAVRTALVGPGDSIRVLATRSSRDGQPTLDRGTIFPLATDAQLPVHPLTTAAAASASGGQLDAALVRITDAVVEDTATVDGNRRLRVNDASGPLEVRLDTIVGFRGPVLAPDTVGARLDVFGLLVPVGPGAWRLKPRAPSDVIPR
jgi:hypothetical protein